MNLMPAWVAVRVHIASCPLPSPKAPGAQHGDD